MSEGGARLEVIDLTPLSQLRPIRSSCLVRLVLKLLESPHPLYRQVFLIHCLCASFTRHFDLCLILRVLFALPVTSNRPPWTVNSILFAWRSHPVITPQFAQKYQFRNPTRGIFIHAPTNVNGNRINSGCSFAVILIVCGSLPSIGAMSAGESMSFVEALISAIVTVTHFLPPAPVA